jgi:hypothetical protein
MHVNTLIGIVGTVVVLIAFVIPLRQIYDYRVTNGAVEVVLFHWLPVVRVHFDDIESAQILSWKEFRLASITTLRMGNRFAARYVLITKKRGWFRHLAITPADPVSFVDQIRLDR